MTHESLLDHDWDGVVERLGGKETLIASAKATKAFLRARAFENAIDMLRMIFAYCLGDGGLRSTAAWAASIGLVDLANTALLYRLRQSERWLTWLLEQMLSSATPQSCQGRMIRVIDATTVLKAGAAAKTKNGLWRIHSAFDLPSERFGHFELTDEHGGERLDRIPVIKNEIRLADRAYMQPDQIAPLLEAGADIVVRAGWKNARWLDADGAAVDIIETFRKAAACGVIDQPIWIGRKSGPALAMRLVAIKKSPEAAEAARNKARREAQKGRHNITESTLIADRARSDDASPQRKRYKARISSVEKVSAGREVTRITHSAWHGGPESREDGPAICGCAGDHAVRGIRAGSDPAGDQGRRLLLPRQAL